jgi:pyruvate,water dikinase
MILSFHVDNVNLEKAGGKGVNLCKLAQAGFPVPDGFIITTPAYHEFLKHNNLADKIFARVGKVQLDEPVSLEETSTEIRSWFREGHTPNQLTEKIESAYHDLDQPGVAVRSSATTEDLPGYSFAGQQDTYLNIIGREALLAAVVSCWSSLWTARAIGYRARNNISHEDIALAVIVQKMVPAEVSGVLFSANPLNGSRLETVIDATLGLGEALVSGQVEPDHYIVASEKKSIQEKSFGSKHITMYGKPDGGTFTEEADKSNQQALPDKRIIELTEFGAKIADLFNYPQDVEWAWADDQFFILQSRPITSLFPIPEGMRQNPLRVMYSFASVQGILLPITPLGQDVIKLLFAGGASLFGFQRDHKTQGIVEIAGERIWVDITPGLHHPIGSRLIPKFLSLIDTSAAKALIRIFEDPILGAGKGRIKSKTVIRLLRFVIPNFMRVLGYVHHPEGKANLILQASQEEINQLRADNQAAGETEKQLQHSIAAIVQLWGAFPYAVPNIFTGLLAGLLPLAILNSFSKHLTGSNDLALEVTRGLPHNVTTEMDLALWETARQIQNDDAALQIMLDSSTESLCSKYHSGELPQTAQKSLESFLEKYGMRGLGEIDFGRPRWKEDPTHIIGVLQSYLQIEDPNLAPDVIFKQGKEAAESAIVELETAARKTSAGWLKAKIVRAAAKRVRELAGLRESPKFHIVQMMWIFRQGLLDSCFELVSKGIIDNADDLFYLYYEELEALTAGEVRNWGQLIHERRRRYSQEMVRMQIPRLLLSDGRVFYEGITPGKGIENQLLGNPVSPGMAEGLVKVVKDPLKADLVPGEIMVCRGTDPAWTPLFLAASGLVMEMGGMMTHGAIVAREYGIPAVVGVNQATTILQNGQRIQVNGSTGEIRFLAE